MTVATLRHVTSQQRFWRSRARFKVAACGRRSGKTELGLRWLIAGENDGTSAGALAETEVTGALYYACAPTRDQAKDLYWDRLKALLPGSVVRRVWEAELKIDLCSGHTAKVVGMDKPERAEGRAVRRALLDETQAMKPEAWASSIRPALSTYGALGSAMILGRPRGRNHFWKLYDFAQRDRIALGSASEWEAFSWPSRDVIDQEEVEAARHSLDPATFAQEYEASFVDLAGRAYYTFAREVHAASRLEYDPAMPLDFCLDFNRAPGVAAVCQTHTHPEHGQIDAWIGQVWIPRESTTEMVCNRLVHDWNPKTGARGKHTREVYVYGDATGGAGGSAKVAGSDWAIAERVLRPVFKLVMRVPKANPREQERVNALNARFRSADGSTHAMVCPVHCPEIVEDLEGTMLVEGGSGELDKPAGTMRTHLTDAMGYRAQMKYPLGGGKELYGLD